MKKSVFLPVWCMLLYVQSASTISEKVWLKDVTSFKTEKRTNDDLDLPDELTFHLTGVSKALTLNLKRNHGIDPNADIYIIRKWKDGQPQLDKALSLEKENVAYYQDIENGAFMTVRCVKRSNGQCDRYMNGNIRIGDKDYDLRLAEADVTSTNKFDVPDLLGTQYLLRNQANSQRYVSTNRKSDATKMNVRNIEQKFKDLLGHSLRVQDKQNSFRLINSSLSSRNLASYNNRWTIDKRMKTTYWIEVLVIIDSSIWDFFVSLAKEHEAQTNLATVDVGIDAQATRMIKEYFSHIINGVHLRYNEINDYSMEMRVTLQNFKIFTMESDLAYKNSLVMSHEGKTYVDINKYLDSLVSMDSQLGFFATHDHAMLFTRHDLVDGSIAKNGTKGRAVRFGICLPGKRISIIQGIDYFEMVYLGTHELGHNLGADHDGEGNGAECPAEDLFIMTPRIPRSYPGKPYSRNPWMFSHCSVRTFKASVKQRHCLNNPGAYFDTDQWHMFTSKLPGEVYSYNEQCEFINGPKSIFCGVVSSDICIDLKCTDPKTGQCHSTVFGSARGTKCGRDKWCKEGLCVGKTSK